MFNVRNVIVLLDASGLLPTLLQIFPYAGMQFGFYAMFKLTWDRLFQLKVFYESM